MFAIQDDPSWPRFRTGKSGSDHASVTRSARQADAPQLPRLPTGPHFAACRLMAIPYLACMAAVAAFNHLPPRVLPSIQAVEGGSVGAVHRNPDGSEDLGPMQVNTRWVRPLARYTGLGEEAVRLRLIALPCFNIAAAGAIMRVYLDEAHGDLMQAVGNYHSHTPVLNQEYQAQVLRSAVRLFVHSEERQRR
jgi:hypothetical protein